MALPPPRPPPVPADPAHPMHAIVYDLSRPSDEDGGIASLLPPGHPDAFQYSSWFYLQLTNRLRALGYQRGEYSLYWRYCTYDDAENDACNLQTHPTLTWMAVDGIVQVLQVVRLGHVGSIY
jgi:hypothetical protein